MQMRYPLTNYIYRPLSVPVAGVLKRTPITPTHVTYVSAALSFGGGVAFGFDAYLLGALLTLLGSITDCVDGDLARITGRSSKAGAYLDHVFDRWTDAALIVGLTASSLEDFALVGIAALVGTFMTSYARTKSQAVGTDADVGIGGRDARMLILVVGAALGFAFAALCVVAVLGFITAVHRMAWTIRTLDAQG